MKVIDLQSINLREIKFAKYNGLTINFAQQLRYRGSELGNIVAETVRIRHHI
jgi:hypothetical protein